MSWWVQTFVYTLSCICFTGMILKLAALTLSFWWQKWHLAVQSSVEILFQNKLRKETIWLSWVYLVVWMVCFENIVWLFVQLVLWHSTLLYNFHCILFFHCAMYYWNKALFWLCRFGKSLWPSYRLLHYLLPFPTNNNLGFIHTYSHASILHVIFLLIKPFNYIIISLSYHNQVICIQQLPW